MCLALTNVMNRSLEGRRNKSMITANFENPLFY